MEAQQTKSYGTSEKIVPQIFNLSPHNNEEKSYLLVSQIPHDWKFIVDTLKPIVERGKMDFGTLLWCIKTFNNRFDYNPEKNLENLKLYFSPLHWEKKSEMENRVFLAIAELILETPALFPNKIPLFVQQNSQKVKLSKRQCACLVAHMFMCTTIQQDNQKLPHTPNFAWIFSKGRSKTGLKIAKIACVVNYLTRVCKETRPTFVVFERLVIGESHGKCTLEAWRSCTQSITKAEIRPKGKMEDAKGAIETDFANKFLGGGVMGKGATQEEIQFITSPDLLIGVLLFEVMAENEAVLMKGAEIYCNYTGYKKEFRFESDYKDTRILVKDDILDREIIAIDALNFKYPDALSQFSDEGVLRELNKAYVGFFGSDNKRDSSVNKPMSTGKWGCGVFRGNLQLKFLIQWLACSRAQRDMYFYSCGDCNELSEAHVIMKHYSDKKVGELVEDVLKCCEGIEKSDKENPDLFGALMALNSIIKEAV